MAHTRQQTCYFDDVGLLRRLDYSVDIPGGIFPDYELTDHTKIQRRLSELQGIDPMIPYPLVPKPGLVIYSVYNNPGGA